MFFRNLRWWFAGSYLAWSLLIYFGSTREHQWWPLGLIPFVLPWSLLFIFAGQRIFSYLVPHPLASDYLLLDAIEGALFIVCGTVWWWYIGKWCSRWYIKSSSAGREI